jgi:hypothetical protein
MCIHTYAYTPSINPSANISCAIPYRSSIYSPTCTNRWGGHSHPSIASHGQLMLTVFDRTPLPTPLVVALPWSGHYPGLGTTLLWCWEEYEIDGMKLLRSSGRVVRTVGLVAAVLISFFEWGKTWILVTSLVILSVFFPLISKGREKGGRWMEGD